MTSPVPLDPWIFHITHIDNLPGILRERGLRSDAERITRGIETTNIGHLHIKQRRLMRPVPVGVGGLLGDYVPFHFCYRSVMLYVVSRGHDDYHGGQENVVHLVSSVSRATQEDRAWAFTDRHAELAHALYFDDLTQLGEVPWDVMRLTYWQDVREERQAEFLVHRFLPWTAIAGIGVMSPMAAARVEEALSDAAHRPGVVVRPTWYY